LYVLDESRHHLAWYKHEILRALEPFPLADKRRLLNEELSRVQRDIAIMRAEHVALTDEAIGALGHFREFCRVVRGYDVEEIHSPNAYLMALGRMFAGLDDVSAEALSRVVEEIEKVTGVVTGKCAVDFDEIATNAKRSYDYLTNLLRAGIAGTFLVHFARGWAKDGFPVVELGHKTAASLMFTHGSGAVDTPWSAFVVKAPDGLVIRAGHSLANVLVRAPSDETASWILLLAFRGGEQHPIVQMRTLDEDEASIRDRLINVSGESKENADELARCIQMVGRLVAGACMLISANDGIEERPWRPKVPPDRRRPPGIEPPEGTRFIVSRNVEIDLRAQVAEYISGRARKGAKLTVQFVVRGHRRWQACGVGHAERKLIWINPFWKGPLEGRALLRGYEIGSVGEPHAPKETP